MSSPTARVFVVDDDPSVRKAVERLLLSAGFKCSSYASAREYLDGYDPDIPGCLLLDLAMPQINGLELQRELVARGGMPPIVFLTGHGTISDTVMAMKLGATEFLTKPVDDKVLINALQDALEKDRVARAARGEVAEIRRRLSTLTQRETQVMTCVIAGLLNKQTAAELGTGEKTIKVHRARVMEKMCVRSVAELVKVAAQVGIAPRS